MRRMKKLLSILLAVVMLAPPLTAQDRATPSLVTVATGSRLAVWTLAGTGTPRRTPVIFLHGGPGLFVTDAARDNGAPLRAAGFTTIYFDQAGAGKSDRLPASQYTLQRAVDDVEALRRSLNVPRIILWGNSYGASLGALYARRFPNHVAGLILSSPGAFPGTDVKRDYRLTKRGRVLIGPELAKAIRLIDQNGARAESSLSQERAGQLFDDIVSTELLDGAICKGSSATPPRLAAGGNLYVNRLLQAELSRTRLSSAPAPGAPAVIIRGECDFLPLANAERYRTAFGGTIVTIDKTGHGLMENKPALDAVLAAFAAGPLATID